MESILNKDGIVTQVLSMKARHIQGNFKVIVTLYQDKDEDGYTCRTSYPFANGNFNFTVAQGRKSQKKLDLINNILDSNSAELTQLWKDGKYQEIVDKVGNEVSL